MPSAGSAPQLGKVRRWRRKSVMSRIALATAGMLFASVALVYAVGAFGIGSERLRVAAEWAQMF